MELSSMESYICSESKSSLSSSSLFHFPLLLQNKKKSLNNRSLPSFYQQELYLIYTVSLPHNLVLGTLKLEPERREIMHIGMILLYGSLRVYPNSGGVLCQHQCSRTPVLSMAKEIHYTCLRKARIHAAEKYRRYHKAAIRNEDFALFHKIDRDLYTLLVLNLDRDAAESMLVIALFLWLERLGCQNLIFSILSSPLVVINMYADEAVVCLKCIYDDNFVSSSTSNDISMLRAFSKSDISLHFLHDNRANAIECINKIMRDVCDRALRDIMERAMQRTVTVDGEGHPDDRTMFVTFSKGYPVSDTEVKEFFNIAFGECVESIQMQEVPPDEQPLFARVVLSSGQKVDQILNGAEKIKFAINGKHVWGRKFVSKRPRFPTAAVAPMPQQLANVLSSLSLN